MIENVYHGTSYKIEYWDMHHLGIGEGQSVFPGVYFTKNKQSAMQYAKMSSQKTGKPPRVYAAEIEIENPLLVHKGQKFFITKPAYKEFCQKYFPNWFNGQEVKPEWSSYFEEKFRTYQGQYNLLRFAADSNNLEYIEVINDLGWDSCIDREDIVIMDPNQILCFEEIYGPDAENTNDSATEAIADRYIVDSRKAKNYKTMPGNRYKRRMMIRTEGGARVWYDIDVNKFFKKDEFLFHIPVIGETDDYTVELEISGWLPILKSDIKQEGFSVKAFKKSLAKAMRMLDVKSHCECDDFRYRFAYWFTQKGDNSGAPESRPAKITNPTDDLGRGCKHILMVLSNKIWCERVARILFNYCFNLYKQNRGLFDRTVGKILGITQEMVENRPIDRRKPKETQPVEEKPQASQQVEKSDEVDKEEQTSDQDDKTDEKLAGESYYGSYYANAKEYDEDQQYMIDFAKEQGVDVLKYISPKNSPEQIWEVTRSIQSKISDEVIKKLSNPDLSVAEMQVLRDSYKKGVDLFDYIGFGADVLKQFYLAAKAGLNISILAKKHFNARQLEQIRQAAIKGEPYEKLLDPNINYDEMKRIRSSWGNK